MIHPFSPKAVNEKYSKTEPSEGLKLISRWVYFWEMLFNPDPATQAKTVCFSRKDEHLTFNDERKL